MKETKAGQQDRGHVSNADLVKVKSNNPSHHHEKIGLQKATTKQAVPIKLLALNLSVSAGRKSKKFQESPRKRSVSKSKKPNQMTRGRIANLILNNGKSPEMGEMT